MPTDIQNPAVAQALSAAKAQYVAANPLSHVMNIFGGR